MPHESAILTKVDKKFSRLNTRIKLSKPNLALKQIEVRSRLKKTQKMFGLIPTKKASNNVDIICQR